MASKSGIKVTAPASISNLACGFDTLGLAIDVVSDEIVGYLSDTPGITITEMRGHKEGISKDPKQNTAAIAAQALLDHLGESSRGIEFRIHKHIQGGSGLGSSASSATAAVVLVNELLNASLSKRDLVPFALEGEKFASGAKHGDNVVPSMIGGLILVRDIEQLDYHRIFTPPGLFVSVVLPKFLLSTKSARSILKPDVPLKLMVQQAANLGSLIIAMQVGDFDLIKRSMVDVVIEPQRKHLIPHFDEIQNLALESGALGCSISGAGPAIFALCQEKLQAEELAKKLNGVFEKNKIDSRFFSGGINHEGAVLK